MKHLNLLLLTFVLLAGCTSDSNPVGSSDTDVEASGVNVTTVAAKAGSVAQVNTQVAALYELQSAFHEAIRNSDSELMHSLWTDDATVVTGAGSASGPDDITELIEGVGPFVNGWASLAPSYKTHFEIKGNRAEYGFECIYAEETGDLTGNEVLAHLNATGTMRKVGNRWLFEHFEGGVGPLP